MESINNLYPYISTTVVSILRMVILAAFSLVIIPWLKNSAIPWLKEKQLYGVVQRFVRAAEKMGDAGIISKEDKLNYVAGLLTRLGVDMTPEVRALIESAVGDLDAELAKNIAAVVEELNKDGQIDDAAKLAVLSAANREPAKPDANIQETIRVGADALGHLASEAEA